MHKKTTKEYIASNLSYGNVALKLANHGYVLETGEIVIKGDAETLQQDESIVKAYPW